MDTEQANYDNYIDVSVKLRLSTKTIYLLDQLKPEYGAKSRAQVIEILLKELLSDADIE